MSIELARDQPLFDRALNIQVVHGVAEPRVVSLVFRVLSGTRATGQSASGQSERLFHFEVRSLAFSACFAHHAAACACLSLTPNHHQHPHPLPTGDGRQ